LQTAAKYPAKVRRLVVASANLRPDAIYPEMRAQQGQVSAAAAEFMRDTPMYQLYQRVAPRPEDFPRLLDKIGEAMAQDFDFTEEVRGLQMPTLVVAADADMAPPSHYVEVFKLLGGGLRDGGWMGEGRPNGGHALAILPGLTHPTIGNSPLVAAQRRRLPLGGVVKTDYMFDSSAAEEAGFNTVRLSELFPSGVRTLFLYNFMYPESPESNMPCPSCTSIVDAVDGSSLHVTQRIGFA